MTPRTKALLIVAAFTLLIVAVFKTPLLRAAGSALVSEDPLAPADIIVVPQWSQEPGAIEAADLVKAGIASRVAVLAEGGNPSTQELIRRGVLPPNNNVWLVSLLRYLGVADVEQIAESANGTENEGDVLPLWCDRHHYHTVVVLSTPDHSRRVKRVLDRSMRGHDTRIIIRYTRYSTYDPSRWWQSRDGTRTEIVEMEKLLLDIVRHPVS